MHAFSDASFKGSNPALGWQRRAALLHIVFSAAEGVGSWAGRLRNGRRLHIVVTEVHICLGCWQGDEMLQPLHSLVDIIMAEQAVYGQVSPDHVLQPCLFVRLVENRLWTCIATC